MVCCANENSDLAVKKSDDCFAVIRQFGVAVYLAYLVSDRERGFSKEYDSEQCRWESAAGGWNMERLGVGQRSCPSCRMTCESAVFRGALSL